VPQWCTTDTKTGSLQVHLDSPQCFLAEIYAQELGVAEAADDFKIIFGEQLLKDLFSGWLIARGLRPSVTPAGEGTMGFTGIQVQTGLSPCLALPLILHRIGTTLSTEGVLARLRAILGGSPAQSQGNGGVLRRARGETHPSHAVETGQCANPGPTSLGAESVTLEASPDASIQARSSRRTPKQDKISRGKRL
jgi:hypothetical protein